MRSIAAVQHAGAGRSNRAPGIPALTAECAARHFAFADSCLGCASMLTESPLYGVSLAVIAKTCQVHPDTARRWKRTGCVPAPALALIGALHSHDLGAIAPAWQGWTLRDGDLVSPEGDRFTPGMVRAGQYHRQRAADLERALPRPAPAVL